LLPTAYWELLASELTVSPQPELLPPTLRLVVYGGEQCNARQVQLWQERFGGYPKLIDSYGPTETTVVATAFAVSDRWDADSQPRTPIGKPIAGVETFVLDSRHKLLPIGIPGELYIGGRGVARGYLNRPELTAERFIPHPLSTDPKARLYRTGDCVRVLPDGNLDYLGRWDRQVKVAGHRIEVGEVEAAIAAHPKVAAVAVTMHQREGMGACLVAYIVEHKDGTCRNLTEIRTFLASKLPQYAIPAGFVSIDALPTTLNGKIDLKQLPPPRWDGQEREIEPPQTQTEETLKDIWCELFQLQHLGRNDNFFELGGSSLLAIRLVTQIERAFAVVLPIAAVVSHPTLAQLAIAIDSGWQADPLEARVGGLAAEVYLDGAIVNAAMGNRLDTDPRNAVFLTGGTGFFGPHLLSEILRQTPATVYCAIRSPKLAMGQDKLISGLKQHHLWREEYASRIVPVAADLSQPFLGLAEAKFNALADIVSAVYHNAAWVNFVYPYSTLKATNVSGTQNILKLAGINRIPVHYVSSMSAFEADPRNFLLESDSPIWEESLLGGGYGASKWVAEKSLELARSQGLPISIYRLGTLVGGSFYQNNFFSCFLKSCLELAAVPSVDGSLNLMAAELVARGLVGLSLEESCSTFHLTHPQSISWLDMVQWFNDFGYGLTPYPFEEWIRRLLRNRGNSLEPFLSILKTAEDLPLDRQTFCTAFTEKRLQAIGMEFPKLGRSTIERYLTDFQEGTRQDRVLVSV
jgi:thioester reductase-like protein